MALFSQAERFLAEVVSELSFANPFLNERVELERKALGKDFDANTRPFWSWTLTDEADRPNVIELTKRATELAVKIRSKIAGGATVSDDEFELYDDLAHYVVYYKTIAYDAGRTAQPAKPPSSVEAWEEFSQLFEHWMNIEGRKAPCYDSKAHVYAYLSQLQRAFFNIFHCVIGRSLPIAKLRARIWQSIFTHDSRRYRRSLFDRMSEVTTLVMGPTGTGKELVARAVGLSQYVPFDVKSRTFDHDPNQETFCALNLSAFSPTLIESELFGHEKGSFTDASARRIGHLETAGRYGCVFLDEIGELDLAIQVKLLRVLQNREFQRIGDNKTRTFAGKFIAATNRDLSLEIENGLFREDFYYRLCSDVIITPTLIAQIEDRPDEIEFLVDFLASRIAPGDKDDLTSDVMAWFGGKKPQGYHWPGNMRELEQCVRNIMIHNDYAPQNRCHSGDKADELANHFRRMELSADELVSHYCELAYSNTKSYEKAAAILKLDRRTVKAKIDLLKDPTT